MRAEAGVEDPAHLMLFKGSGGIVSGSGIHGVEPLLGIGKAGDDDDGDTGFACQGEKRLQMTIAGGDKQQVGTKAVEPIGTIATGEDRIFHDPGFPLG